MRVFNFGQNFHSKFPLRLIRGSTYTRVYTVVTIVKTSFYICKIIISPKLFVKYLFTYTFCMCLSCFLALLVSLVVPVLNSFPATSVSSHLNLLISGNCFVLDLKLSKDLSYLSNVLPILLVFTVLKILVSA
jgi:hypothetical protein